MSEEKAQTELVEEWIEQGVSTAEEIHRSVAEMPLGVLERLGLLQSVTGDVRHIQDVSLDAIYGLVRDVNHKLAGLAGELLEERSAGGDVAADL